MGLATAIVGGLGLVGGLVANRERSDAISDASAAQQQSTDAAVNLQRDIYNDQVDRLEPFRQQELQRANALGEIFGFDYIGDNMGARSTAGQAGQTPYNFTDPRTPFNFNDFLANYTADGGYMQGGYANPVIQGYQSGQAGGASAGAPQGAGYVDENGNELYGQDAALARFNASPFNDVYRETHARDVDRIDAGLSSQGLAFSGARMQAVEDARADRFGQTFNSYLATLMGSPPQQATNATNQAAGAFGANAGNAMLQQGQNAAQSAYAQGNNDANLINGVAGVAGWGLGQSGWFGG